MIYFFGFCMKNVVYSLIFTGILASAENIFATNSSMLEIFGDESADVPNVAPLQAGKLSDKTRKFDLICTGRCNAGNNSVPLKIEDHEIPDLFTIDADGSVVIAPAKPMATITMPKGHKSFVKITLQNIAGQSSDVPDWVYLGIRQKGEITDTVNTKSTTKELNIAMFSEDVVELVPLVSGTSGSYTKVEPGTKISAISGFPQTSGDIKFGAVYKVKIEDVGLWITLQGCGLELDGASIFNLGSFGIGPIIGQQGKQLLGVSEDELFFAYSSDGVHWCKMEGKLSGGDWLTGPKYGNGVWCVVSSAAPLLRSTNDADTWLPVSEDDPGSTIRAQCLAFDNGLFMTIDKDTGYVYTSTKADNWAKTGEAVKNCVILICGSDKWICGNLSGDLYQSENGKGKWQPIMDSNLNNLCEGTTKNWHGGCYTNGYFYVVGKITDVDNEGNTSFAIARSNNGANWESVANLVLPENSDGYNNITYYKNKLHALSRYGDYSSIGLP